MCVYVHVCVRVCVNVHVRVYICVCVCVIGCGLSPKPLVTYAKIMVRIKVKGQSHRPFVTSVIT